MRHVNDLYTQRYNRLKRTDGPLFRGRYKAVLVSQDEYLLQLSRYIHRNPIDTNIPMVERLEDYLWSSYPAFVGLREPEDWLERAFTYQLLKHPKPFEDYRHYVMQGVDEGTKKFHEKGNMGAIFGDETFKQWVFDELMPKLAAEGKSRVIQPNLTMPIIAEGVAAYYNTTPEALLKCTRGPQHNNEPRKVAMYLSQELAAARLVEIADYFNLNHYGSVGFATCQIRQLKKADRQFALKLTELIKGLIKSNS
jgi:putative transposase